MRYILYDKTTKKILMISNEPITTVNENHEVVTTDITHDYIYIDQDGVVREYPPETIEKIKQEEANIARLKASQSLRKYINFITQQWKSLIEVIPPPTIDEINAYDEETEKYISKESDTVSDDIALKVLYYKVLNTLYKVEYSFKKTIQDLNDKELIREELNKSRSVLEQLQLRPPSKL